MASFWKCEAASGTSGEVAELLANGHGKRLGGLEVVGVAVAPGTMARVVGA